MAAHTWPAQGTPARQRSRNARNPWRQRKGNPKRRPSDELIDSLKRYTTIVADTGDFAAIAAYPRNAFRRGAKEVPDTSKGPCRCIVAVQCMQCTALHAVWGGCNDATMQRCNPGHAADLAKGRRVRIGGHARQLLDAQGISRGFGNCVAKPLAGANLDAKANLDILGLDTRGIRPGFRYVLGVVSREGVKTVNKKALPEQ
jgi:hypothetical protein